MVRKTKLWSDRSPMYFDGVCLKEMKLLVDSPTIIAGKDLLLLMSHEMSGQISRSRKGSFTMRKMAGIGFQSLMNS